MLKRDFIGGHFHHSRLRVHFDMRFAQRVFDKLTDLITHAGHHFVAHFNNQHSRFALECAAFERVEKQVSHFGRKFTAAGACANDRKCQFAAYVLGRHLGRNSIERSDHSLAQFVGVSESCGKVTRTLPRLRPRRSS